jgi:hypothetical protein
MRYFRHPVLAFWFFFTFASILTLVLAYNIPKNENVSNPVLSVASKHTIIEGTANGLGMIISGEGNSWATSFQADINSIMPSLTPAQKITFTNISNKLVLIQNAQTVDDKLNIYHSFENQIIPSLAI